MGAHFDNAPGFHHGDMVRIADRAEPMGDHKCRAPHREIFEGSLDLAFGLGIKCGSGLIQNEDWRVAQENPGDGHTLFLPARERYTAFAHDSIKPVWQLVDHIAQAGFFGGEADLFFGGVQSAIGDVFAQRTAKQEYILTDDPDLRAQGAQSKRANIMPVDQHPARLGFIETWHQR